MTITDALRMIASRAPSVSQEAARALLITSQAARQVRYDSVAQVALGDTDAGWSADERALIVSLMAGREPGETRGSWLQVRVSPTERALIEARANEAGVSVSEFIRRIALG
jgi:hypothetical protein